MMCTGRCGTQHCRTEMGVFQAVLSGLQLDVVLMR